MQNDSKLQKLEIHVVATVAVALVAGSAFLLSAPFSAQDYDVSDASAASQHSSRSPSATSQDVPAMLEPALRSLDGVPYHG